MNKQLIFDTVREHLLQQGEASLNVLHNQSAYRGAGGRKCAIGCLIPDENYDARLEGKPVRRVAVVRAIDAKFGCTEKDARGYFLYDLQGIHDWNDSTEWARELEEFRLGNGLK